MQGGYRRRCLRLIRQPAENALALSMNRIGLTCEDVFSRLTAMNKIFIKKGGVEISVEGDAKFVEKYLLVLKKEIIDVAPIQKEIPSGKVGTIDTPSSNLLDFYNEKKPSTHYDKIAVFGYYLTESLGKKVFTKGDINQCYLELRKTTKLPGNLEVTLSDTIRNTGYIKRAKKNSFELTPAGINYVLHQLPAGTDRA